MARERLVTRTIKGNKYTVKAFNMKASAIEDITIETGLQDIRDERAFIEKNMSDEYKFIMVLSKEETEVIYGMKESDFIKYAVKMDNRFKLESEDNKE